MSEDPFLICIQDEEMVCPKCGGKLLPYRTENTAGTICENNDWSLVTSVGSPAFDDQNIYEFMLLPSDININNIRSIADLLNVNFLEAKRILEKKNPVVIKGSAFDIIEKVKLLRKSSLKYKESPQFPHA